MDTFRCEIAEMQESMAMINMDLFFWLAGISPAIFTEKLQRPRVQPGGVVDLDAVGAAAP